MSDQSDDDWDTGNDCSVCGDAPVVNIPGGSGAYWLCGGCVADSLDEKQVSVDFWKGAAARDIEQKKRIQSRLDASKVFGDELMTLIYNKVGHNWDDEKRIWTLLANLCNARAEEDQEQHMEVKFKCDKCGWEGEGSE